MDMIDIRYVEEGMCDWCGKDDVVAGVRQTEVIFLEPPKLAAARVSVRPYCRSCFEKRIVKQLLEEFNEAVEVFEKGE